jgi:uncharacterized RmlC-like cupin family protein
MINSLTTTDDAKPTCRVIGAGEEVVGKQGHPHAPGISAQSAGAQGIHMQIVRLPPGNRSNAHKHEGHETAIYVLSGEAGMWYGETCNTISSSARESFSTSPPTCLICLTIRVMRKAAWLSSRAPIPTIRRASCCCRNWSAGRMRLFAVHRSSGRDSA